MEIGPLLPLFRRRWWILVVAVIAASVGGLIVASRIAPTYVAVTTILVGPVNGDTGTLQASSLLVATYADLATGNSLLGEIGDAVGVNLVDQNGAVRVTGNDTTRLVSIRVELENPATAVRVAGSIADRLLSLSVGSAAGPAGKLEVIDRAVDATQAPSKVPILTLLAGAGGVVLAALIVIALEAASPAVRSEGEAESSAEAPVLAVIRDRGTAGRRRSLAGVPPLQAEYALIAAHLLAREDADNALIVSSSAREHAGDVILDLARAIAAAGRSVTILADDQRDVAAVPPIAHPSDGKPRRAPAKARRPRRDVELTDAPGVLVSLRDPTGQPSTTVEWDAAAELAAAAHRGRFVLVDGATAAGPGAATNWVAVVSSTLVIVSIGLTNRRALFATVRALRTAGAKQLDLIVLGFRTDQRPILWGDAAMAGEGRGGSSASSGSRAGPPGSVGAGSLSPPPATGQ